MQPSFEEETSNWVRCPHCRERLSVIEIHISEVCPYCDRQHGLQQ